MPRGRSPSPRSRGRSPVRYGAAVYKPAPAPAPPGPDTLRTIIFKLGGALIQDIVTEFLLVICTLCLLPTWRLPATIRIYRLWTNRRRQLFNEFGELLLDFLIGGPALLIVFATLYRLPKVLSKLLSPNFRGTLEAERDATVKDVANVLYTSGALLCGALVYITLWRIRYLRDQQQATVASPLWNWKRICYFQALMLICDLLLIPLLPFLIIGPWRIKDLWNDQFAPPPSSRVNYWKTYSMVYGEQRTAVLHTAGEVILDYICFLVVLLIIVTVVRIKTLWRAIRQRKDEKESFRESFVRTFKEEMTGAPTAATITVGAAAVGNLDAVVRAAKENLTGLTQVTLKELLRKNDQAFSGLTTKQLIDKIADQQVRGKIPRCPRCFGGKLRFENRRYYCPGYADDEGRFHRCSFTAGEHEITREPWQN